MLELLKWSISIFIGKAYLEDINMQQSRDIIISADCKIIDALIQLNNTKKKVLICVNSDGTLAGVVGDGDIRRGLIKGKDLKSNLRKSLNPCPIFVNIQANEQEAGSLLSAKIPVIPVIDT